MVDGLVTIFGLIFFLTVITFVISTIWAIVNHAKKKPIKKQKLGIIVSAAIAVLSFIVATIASSNAPGNNLAIYDIKSNYVVKGKEKNIDGHIEPNSDNPHIYLYENGEKIGSTKTGKNGGFELTVGPGKYKVVAENDYTKVSKKFTVSKPKKTKAQLAAESSKASSEKAANASSKAAKESSQAVESSKKAAAKASSKAAAAASKASSKAASESSSAAYSASVASSEAYEKSPESYQNGATYDQLARTPDDYEGDKIAFTGKVIQVMEDGGDTQLRLAVDGDYDHVILVDVSEDVRGGSHILEDDLINAYGLSAGTITYESTMGGDITVPAMSAKIVEDKGTASEDYGY